MSLKKIVTKNLEDNAITTDKIQDTSVTAVKLSTDFITGLVSMDAAPVDSDFFLLYDTSAGDLKKVLNSNFPLLFNPVISSVSPDNVQTASGSINVEVVITGTGFTSGSTAYLVGSSGQHLYFTTTVRNSTTQITGTIPRSSFLIAQSPYGIKVESGEGYGVTTNSLIDVDTNPVFVTAAGSLGSVLEEESFSATVTAYDPDSTSHVDFEIISGALPSGITITNDGTDTATISGTAPVVASDTTYNFTLRAYDTSSNYNDRAFSIVVQNFQLNGLRFDDGSSDNLTQTFSTDGTSADIGTLSVWLKRSLISSEQVIISAGTSARDFFRFESDDTLTLRRVSTYQLTTTQVFRDTSAWYHIVLAFDTSQATSSNRIKMYVNGSQITAFGTATYPSQNLDIKLGSAQLNAIGKDSEQTTPYFDGYMSEMHFVDGQALTPTDFGKTDAASGIWLPKKYSGSYGTNGFFLPFDNAADLGADASGNANDFTENNLTSIDKVTDTPQNNFATWSPLFGGNAQYATFSEGNLKLAGNNASNAGTNLNSTIGASSGKYYMEIKALDIQGASYPGVGVMMEDDVFVSIGQVGGNPNSVSYRPGGTVITNGGVTSTQSAYTDNDIIGIALDLDNGAVYFSKNGVFENSGDPTSGASRTGSLYNFTPSSKVYFFAATVYQTTAIISANFGNAPYTISSGNADGNGYGNFEYAVPTGYLSLNTKNLAEVNS